MLELSTKRLGHFLLLAEQITVFKANKYQINPDTFRVNELMSKLVELLQDRIQEKNLRVKFEFNKKEDEDIYADKQLIEICLNEVIDNAIKYSSKGDTIILRSFAQDKEQVIEVIDEGPGFPEIVLKNIFKTFITDDDISKQGMGLDLALINLIIKTHRGHIEITNNKHRGATVRLSFAKYDQETGRSRENMLTYEQIVHHINNNNL